MSKIKIQVELDDLWIEEDESIDDAIKNHIVLTVTHDIWAKIKGKVDSDIAKKITKEIDESLHQKIQERIDLLIEHDTYKVEGRGEAVSIKKMITDKFEEKTNYHYSVTEGIDRSAKRFAEELRERYDLINAAQIVTKLSEKGLLKDDNIKKLLET